MHESHKKTYSSEKLRHRVAESWLWVAAIVVASIFLFLIYFSPASLHDTAHYVVSGIALIRDHRNLLYPYLPHRPLGLGNAYEYLQNNTINFEARTSFPSKLYSAIFGFIWLLTGWVRFEYAQWLAAFCYVLSNIILYLIGRRYFAGFYLLLFLVSVVFLPVTRVELFPSSDGIAYTASLVLLWLCLCLNINPFTLGLFAGVFSHFRGQMLSLLLIFPFIYTAISDRSYFRQALLPMVLGFAISYGVMTSIFNLATGATSEGSSVDFYIRHFTTSIYGFGDIYIVLNKLITSLVALFDKNQLLVYAAFVLLCALWRNARFQNRLAIAALLYIGLSLVLYSFDRFAPPQPRYYLFAIPLIALAVFTGAKAVAANTSLAVPLKIALAIFTSIIVSAWYTTHGFPIDQLKYNVLASRARFLDFEGVEKALAANFKKDDIVIVNHSLPSGLSRLHNLVYVPPFKLFQAGDNSMITGIIFVYGDNPPNDFFKPRDWLQGNVLPPAISDSKGITFNQVYASTSNIFTLDGTAGTTARFYIYKKSTVDGASPAEPATGGLWA